MKLVKLMLFSLLFLTVGTTFANNDDPTLETSSLEFSETVTLNHMSAADIYQNVLEVQARAFDGTAAVIHAVQDEKIILVAFKDYKQKRSYWGASERTKGKISYLVEIDVFQNGYNYTFRDFKHTADNGWSFGNLTESTGYPGNIRKSTPKFRDRIWRDLQRNAVNEIGAVGLEIKRVISRQKKDPIFEYNENVPISRVHKL